MRTGSWWRYSSHPWRSQAAAGRAYLTPRGGRNTPNNSGVVEPIRTARLNLVPIDPDAIRRLIAGDRTGAEHVFGLSLPAEFPDQGELEGFLRVQLERMERQPSRRDWLARMMVGSAGEAVGHCGFHGPPETVGRAEIGYTVFTAFRGQGFAKEAARALVDWAFRQGEPEVYASVSPGNAPSLAVVKAVGFIQVATQMDEVDGLELVFRIRASDR
jgi:ribosomal-protein-alanine N-acetyltransferase